MTNVKARIFLVVVPFVVLAFQLSKDLDFGFNIRLVKDVSKADTETTQLPPNSSYLYPWPPCQPNTSAATVEGFSELPERMQDFIYYQHCRHFPMLQDVPDKCGRPNNSADTFLLLVIKSSPGNYERREVLRKTWAKEKIHNGVQIQRVFLSGTTGDGFEKLRQNKLLDLEQREHNDILQWDFKDSFINLTLKQVLFYEWMDRNCPNVHFLFNGDDDVFVHTENIIVFLQGLRENNGSKHLFIGKLVTKSAAIRDKDSKYYVPEQLHPKRFFPFYCSGGGYIMSGYTGRVIYNMSSSVPLSPIDDVYMGMCLLRAGLEPSDHMGMRSNGMPIPSKQFDQYDPCFYREILMAHKFIPADLYLLWHRVHDQTLICLQEKKSP